jgi:iron complex outermembrane recepter protein
MKARSNWPLGASIVGASLSLIAVPVLSADAPPSTATSTLEEVVVTAQFRSQNLQLTPIAITAVNAAMLEQRNQTDIAQVANQAPNVTLQANGEGFGSSLIAFIRGVGQTDFDMAEEPGVGIYVDDVYYATLTGSVLDLLDLDRVEILRGPQGTLAGKNSIGGAVKLYSQLPTGEGGGYLDATYGSLNRVDMRGAGDFTLLPDKLFARVSFASKHHDGYITRVDYACTHANSNLPSQVGGDGCTLGKDGGQAYNAARIAFRLLPLDNIEWNVAADITNDQSGAQANTIINFNPASLGGFVYTPGVNGKPVFYGSQFIPYGPHSTDPNHPNNPYLSYATYSSHVCSIIFGCDPYAPVSVPPINHFDTWGVSSNLRWELADKLTLNSITAYRAYSNEFAEDSDGSPIGEQILMSTQRHHQISQELRLNGSVGSAVDYTVGGFYMHQGGGLTARAGLPYVGLDFIHGPDSVPSRTYAGFANAEWHVTEKLNLVGGVRYSDDEKTYHYVRYNIDGSPITANAYNGLITGLDGRTASFKGTHTDYRADLDYQFTPDVMGYAEVSTGYKGGGVNPRPIFASQTLLTFQPETLTAYEVGIKTNLFDHRMRLNLSAFYNTYNNIQLTLLSCPTPPLNGIQYPATPCDTPANVGAAHVKGVEGEWEFHPVGGLEIDASASYLDFKYTKINDPSSGVTPGMVTPYTPKYKASLGVQYEVPVADRGSLTPRLDLAYQSSEFAAPVNDPAWNQINGYAVLNGRLTWRDKADVWQASLNVTNVTNKLYYLTLYDTHESPGFVGAQPAMPREWSITVKRKF